MQIKETLGYPSKIPEGRERPNGSGKATEKSATASGAEAAAAASDRVELSGRSREMAKASEVLAATPSVRSDMVNEIRRRLENNEYQVDSEKLADKMIVDFLRDVV